MQKSFQFDKKTIEKIIKGAIIAGTGSAAIFILNYIGTVDFGDNMAMASFVAWFVPTAVNLIKEWMKGNENG